MDDWGKIIAAIVSGVFTILAFMIKKHFDDKKLRRSLIDSLMAELKVNKKVIEESKKNAEVIEKAKSSANQNEPISSITVEDESQLYITILVDIPLTTWVSQEVQKLIPAFPVSALIDYKLSVARANYLIQRNMQFKYRVHFLCTLKDALDVLSREIQKIEDRLKELKLTE